MNCLEQWIYGRHNFMWKVNEPDLTTTKTTIITTMHRIRQWLNAIHWRKITLTRAHTHTSKPVNRIRLEKSYCNSNWLCAKSKSNTFEMICEATVTILGQAFALKCKLFDRKWKRGYVRDKTKYTKRKTPKESRIHFSFE